MHKVLQLLDLTVAKFHKPVPALQILSSVLEVIQRMRLGMVGIVSIENDCIIGMRLVKVGEVNAHFQTLPAQCFGIRRDQIAFGRGFLDNVQFAKLGIPRCNTVMVFRC